MNTSISFTSIEMPEACVPSFNSISTIHSQITMSNSQVSLYRSQTDHFHCKKATPERPLAVSTLVFEENQAQENHQPCQGQGRFAESIYLSTQLLQAQHNNQETIIHDNKASLSVFGRNSAKQGKYESSPKAHYRSDEVEIWKRKYAELEQVVAHYMSLYQAATEDITKLCDKLLNARQELIEYEALKIRFHKLEMEVRPAVETKDRIQALLGDLETKKSVQISQNWERMEELKLNLKFDGEEKEGLKSQILNMKESGKIFGDELRQLGGKVCTSGYFVENFSSYSENEKSCTDNILGGQLYLSLVVNEKETTQEKASFIGENLKQSILMAN